MSMPLIARQAPAPMPWLASWNWYILSQIPTVLLASKFKINCFSVVSMSFATAVWARPWCASPQPVTPAAVETLTMTASRLIAVPMPSATRLASGIGNEVGKAWTSVMRSSGIEDFRVDEVEGALSCEHAQHLAGGGDAGAPARGARDAREVRGQDDVVELEQLVVGWQPVVLVDVQHRT